MYGFNGQVPGPLIRVPQNATITVRFHNRIDLPSTVHWHGVRLDNRFDGVLGLTQDSVATDADFVYTVYFLDAGIYWYHPHVREDIEQAMGLFGNMLVDSPRRPHPIMPSRSPRFAPTVPCRATSSAIASTSTRRRTSR
jgi:suppressor of ftsI